MRLSSSVKQESSVSQVAVINIVSYAPLTTASTETMMNV